MQIGLWQRAVDEAISLGDISCDFVAAKDHFKRPHPTHQTRETLRSCPTGHHPKRCFELHQR